MAKKVEKMDTHFKESPIEKNIPICLALIGIWNSNFLGSHTHGIIPYTEYLNLLPSYLQQSMMESNGKNIDRSGNKINYSTGNIIWGGTGTNTQHAFFQLIHQGDKLIPCDFIYSSSYGLGFAVFTLVMPTYHEPVVAATPNLPSFMS